MITENGKEKEVYLAHLKGNKKIFVLITPNYNISIGEHRRNIISGLNEKIGHDVVEGVKYIKRIEL